MHMYLFTRGINWDVKRAVTDLGAQFLSRKFRNNVHDTNEPLKDGATAIAMRPIQFWEMVFPEAHLDTIMNTLWPDTSKTEGHFGNQATMKYRKVIPILRRVLGKDVMALPTEYKKNMFLPMYNQNVEWVGIGIKKDPFINDVEML